MINNNETDLIGMFIAYYFNQQTNNITNLFRLKDENGQILLPLFTLRKLARNFIEHVENNKNIKLFQLQSEQVKYVVQMCKEENFILAVDIHVGTNGYEFKNVILNGN